MLRIAWVTPFSRRSAIGRFSAAVCRMLAEQNHDPVIVRSEHRKSISEPVWDDGLSMCWWHDTQPHELASSFDATVVNIGDSFEDHAGIFRYLPEQSCLGIFHDNCLYRLFNGWLANQPDTDLLHDRIIEAHYDDEVVAFMKNARQGSAALGTIADKLPMTEWVSAQCGGAIAHAGNCRTRLELVPGPVRILDLQQESEGAEPLPSPGYVAKLIICLDEFVQCKPYLEVARSIGKELAILGLDPSDPAIGRVADCMDEVFLASP